MFVVLTLYIMVAIGVWIGLYDNAPEVTFWGRIFGALIWPIGVGYILASD
jgi:hypothetical protein